MSAEPARIWKTGERVRVTYEGRNVPGVIMLALGNGRSLMLSFDALLGGYAGMMPVLWDGDAAEYRCLIERRTVRLRPVGFGQTGYHDD